MTSPPPPPPASRPPGLSGRHRTFAALGVEEVFGPLPPGLVGELCHAALHAAAAAAALLADAVDRPREAVEHKSSPTDMVSEVDRAAEALVTEVLTGLRPDDGILGEEGAAKPGTTGVRWVVDPLDGTTNFLFGIPQFAVSVAAELDEVAVVGVVIDPSHDETWAARRDGGSRCNGTPCRVVQGRSTLPTALVGTGFGYRRETRAWQARVAAELVPAVRDIRRLGAAALDLCWVAGGRLDAYYEWGLYPWDWAAGRLICTEAGAQVEQLDGGTLLAASPELAGPLAALLASTGALEPPPGLGEE